MKVQSQFIEMFGDPMTNSKGWSEHGKINKYAQIILGSTPNSKEASYWDGDIKWITPAEMTEESYYIYDTEHHITEEGVNSASLTLLPYRSVLFSTRAPIGKVGLVGSPMYCNQGFKNFICGNQLNPVYLYYSLIYKREYLVSLGTGTTFKELSKKTVEGLELAIPPIYLQEQFEKIYDQADKSKFVGFKSQFIEMFDGDKYHQMELDSIAEVWLKGQAFKKDNICEEGANFCIHYGELFTKYGPIIYDVSSTTNDEIMKASKSGDILFPASDVTPDGLARCSTIMRDEVLLGGDIIVLRPKQGNNPEYLSWAINMQKEQLLKRVTGSVVRHMSAKGLKTVQIPIAPIDKQKQFIKIVKQADKSKYYN